MHKLLERVDNYVFAVKNDIVNFSVAQLRVCYRRMSKVVFFSNCIARSRSSMRLFTVGISSLLYTSNARVIARVFDAL